MKKITIASIALSATILFALACPAMNTQAEAQTLSQANRQELVQELIDLQTEASLSNNSTKLNSISKQLRDLGVKEITYEEFVELNSHISSSLQREISLLSSAEDTRYQLDYVNLTYNGKACNVRIIYMTPIESTSPLHHTGVLGVQNKTNVQASKNAISIVCNTAFGIISDSYGITVSLYDAVKNIISGFNNISVLENISASYTYSAIESLCFLYSESPTIPNAYSFQCVSNKATINIAANYINFVYNGIDHTDSSIITSTLNDNYTSPMYGNYSEIGRFMTTGTKNYGEEVRLKSFDIYGIDGTYLRTIQMSDAFNPSEI